MTKLSACTWSAVGLVLLLACSSSKSDSFNTNNSTATGSTPGTGVGSTTGTGISTGTSGSGSSNSTTNGGTASTTSTVGTGSTNTGTGSTGTGTGSTGTGSKTGTGSTSSTTAGGAGGSTVISTAGAEGTYDPPPATGGSGSTQDPPKGGSGNTTDPPPGDTIDPPPGDTIDPPPGDTIDPPPGDTIDPPPGDTIDPPPGCTFTEIDKVNVIVFKDATPNGADSEGRMWVGGNLTMNGGYAVNTTTDPPSTCNDWALVVNGNIVGNPLVSSGKVAYGGTLTGNPSVACGIYHTKPIDFVALETKFLGYSAAFVAYPTQNPSVLGTAKVSGGYLVLTGTNSALNVFNISAAELASNSLQFAVPATSSVIVNVSGKTVNWTGKGFKLPDGTGACKAGTSSWCHKILYNLYEATDVYMSGIGVQGSVLAPFATVDGGGGNIDGQLVCRYLKGGLEYHPYFFSGCLLLPKI